MGNCSYVGTLTRGLRRPKSRTAAAYAVRRGSAVVPRSLPERLRLAPWPQDETAVSGAPSAEWVVKKETLPSASRMASSTSARSRMPCWRAVARRSDSVKRCCRGRCREESAVAEDDQRLAADDRPGPGEPPLQPGKSDGHQGEDRDGEDAGGDRVVLLGDRLLDQVSHGDVQEQLEGAELAQSRAPDSTVTAHRNTNITLARITISTVASPPGLGQSRHQPSPIVHGDHRGAAVDHRHRVAERPCWLAGWM